MLFSCQPYGSVSSAPSRKVSSASAARGVTVDIHCHAHIGGVDDLLAKSFDPLSEPMLRYATQATRDVNRRMMENVQDKLTSVGERLADMDRMGIDVQAISCSPFQFYYWADPETGLQAARAVNDGIAEMVARERSRFVGLATVPMQAPELAIGELNRAVGELGFRGVQISTSVQGEDLSSQRFEPFFARAAELDVLLFLHPNGFADGQRLTNHYFINIIGNPLDSTVAVSHLIFGGVLKRHQGLKICIAHGGGYLPFYASRMDHAHAVRPDCRSCIDERPSDYLRRLYFDTVVFTPEQLEYLVAQYGSDHVLMGTDYPYDMGEPDPVGLIARTKSLKAFERRALLGENAARLLKLTHGHGRSSVKRSPAARRARSAARA